MNNLLLITNFIILLSIKINKLFSADCGLKSNAINCPDGFALKGQTHIGIPAACFLSVDAGPCSQDLVRIYYDSKTFTCKSFSYSGIYKNKWFSNHEENKFNEMYYYLGCGGNANRFVSVKNCYKLCHPYYRQRFIGLAVDQAVGIKVDQEINSEKCIEFLTVAINIISCYLL